MNKVSQNIIELNADDHCCVESGYYYQEYRSAVDSIFVNSDYYKLNAPAWVRARLVAFGEIFLALCRSNRNPYIPVMCQSFPMIKIDFQKIDHNRIDSSVVVVEVFYHEDQREVIEVVYDIKNDYISKIESELLAAWKMVGGESLEFSFDVFNDRGNYDY